MAPINLTISYCGGYFYMHKWIYARNVITHGPQQVKAQETHYDSYMGSRYPTERTRFVADLFCKPVVRTTFGHKNEYVKMQRSLSVGIYQALDYITTQIACMRYQS